MSVQIPLDLAPELHPSFDNFITSATNDEAFRLVRNWPGDSFPILAVIGPGGVGKTHLGQAWLSQTANACQFTADMLGQPSRLQDCHLWLDDADDHSEEVLFTLINRVLNGETPSLLMTAATPIEAWPIELPDLRSRLANVISVAMTPQDDAILEPLLRKMFEDRGREVGADLTAYILSHCDRSPPALMRLVKELDLSAQQEKKDLTRSFAIRFLKRAG